MMDTQFKYDKVETVDAEIALAQGEQEIRIRGNQAYDRLVGYMILVHDADGNLYAKRVKVSVSDVATGDAILPLQPYDSIRPSMMEKPADRVIKTNVRASGTDFKFRVESAAHTGALRMTVVAYITNKK